MAKVAGVVRDALLHLRAVAASHAIKAGDMQDGIRALNLMMREQEAYGQALGWSDVALPTDDLPLPPELEGGVGYMLAVRLRAQYGRPLEADVVAQARACEALMAAMVAAHDFARLDYPDLPAGVGSGGGEDEFLAGY